MHQHQPVHLRLSEKGIAKMKTEYSRPVEMGLPALVLTGLALGSSHLGAAGTASEGALTDASALARNIGSRFAVLRPQIYRRDTEFNKLDVNGNEFFKLSEYNGTGQLFADMDSIVDKRLSPSEAKFMMTCVGIPAGTFAMGADNPLRSGNKEAPPECVASFFI